MPIVSKALINLGQQADGTFRVREEHTDTLNIVWRFQYRAPDLATATGIMDARDLTDSLKDRDFIELRNHVATGFPNGPDTFEYATPLRDITELEAEDEIVTYAAGQDGDIAQPFAWFIQNLNVPQWDTIEARIGYTGLQGDDIRDRMTAIITAAPLYNTVIDDPR